MKETPETEQILLGRTGNDVKMGIVGMPNIGKSSLFNVLSDQSVPAENYPFCTIDPHTARVKVPDKRFDYLCAKYNPKSKVPASLTVIDIAGLVRGASENKGLGNAFLSHIYGVDGIFHLVRAFKDSSIEHVEGEINPVRDIEIITNELRQKDIEILEKKIKSSERLVSSSRDKTLKERHSCYQKLLTILKNSKAILSEKWTVNELGHINDLYLLMAKPQIFLVNVSYSNWISGKNKWLAEIKDHVRKNYSSTNSLVIPFCAKFEAKLEEFGGDIEAKKSFLAENKTRSHLSKIIRSGYSALSLCHFFTCGEKEVKCWTTRRGTKAKKAAGIIHSDFEEHFIRAQVMAFDDLKKFETIAQVRANGRLRTEGKEYVVKDGDIIVFKHNAGGASGSKKK